MKTKNLCLITVGQKSYFGSYDTRVQVITHSIPATDFSKELMQSWIKKQNVGDTKTVTIGSADSVSITELSDMEQIEVKDAVAKFELARTISMRYVENDAYDRLLGKS